MSTHLSMARMAALALPLVAIVGCGDDEKSSAAPKGDGDAAASVCLTAPAPQKIAGAYEVMIESPPAVTDSIHVPEGTQVEYCSNPPSSGDHYAVWASFQEHPVPIEWPYLVHSMEHGAVVLLYKCDPPGCPDVVDQLKQVRDNAAADPLCPAGTKRIIIAPSPTIPTKVAAAAWGKTYRAPCVDTPSLEAFVRDNYAKGPENVCAPGRIF